MTMTASHALDAGATVANVLWVAGRLGERERCVRFALACARRVAHLISDPRVTAALDATQAWLDNPCAETAGAAAYAAGAAYAAAEAVETVAQVVLCKEIFA